MKSNALSHFLKATMVAGLFVVAQQAIAQDKDAPKADKKYKLMVIKEENGKKQVIDKTFASEKEMKDYMKAQKIDLAELPEIADVPEPPLPPTPPVPPTAPKHPKKVEKCEKTCQVIIINGDEKEMEGENAKVRMLKSKGDGDENMEIVINDGKGKNKKVITKVITINDEGDKKAEKISDEKGQQKIEIVAPEAKEEGATNIGDLKFYPNPNNGNFHVEFSIKDPADVKLTINDLSGKEVYTENMKNYSGRFVKDVHQNLAAGTYLLNVQAGGEKNVLKVVVQ